MRPDYAEALNNRGRLLDAEGRLDAAMTCFERALEIKPEYVSALNNAGVALNKLARFDEAIVLFKRSLALEPDNANALYNLGTAFLGKGDPLCALEVADALLRTSPRETRALSVRAVALWELGRAAEARYLVDYDRLLALSRPSAASAIGGVEAFNRALADHIQGHPSLEYEKADRAAHGGSHSGDLLTEPRGPVDELVTRIDGALETYLRDLPADPKHPFLSQRPRRWRLHMWGVVLEGGGHHISHNHPSGWVSGVYYVQVPRRPDRSTPDHAGWLEFGKPHASLRTTIEPETKWVKPEDGLMVLFPSYFYHRTTPHEGDGRRINIGFDAVPSEWAG